CGARVHRARPDGQVRGLLSRTRGFAAGEGRIRTGDAGNRGHTGCAEGVRRYHDRAALQFAGSFGRGVPRAWGADRGGDCGTGSGQHGMRASPAGYLEGLREITARYGALLIFDEVMTGFRVAFGGAQARYGIRPDLTTLGKVIGGGLPVGAYGGRRDIMSMVAPAGPIYQAGTLSGNPLAVAAGLAMLRHLKAHPEVYERLESQAAKLQAAAPPGI